MINSAFRPGIQLFAQAGAEGTDGLNTGDNNGTGYADAAHTDTGAADSETRFSELISGEYRDEFTKRTQAIIDKRFKETKRLEGEREQLGPILDDMYRRYGVEQGDINSLAQAYNAHAEKSRNAEQSAQERAKGDVARWLEQGKELKSIYPSFDFAAEAKGSREFVRLLASGVPVRTAYEVLHKDQILGQAMEYTAKKVSEQVVKGIEARGMRPAENGVSSGSGLVGRIDVNALSPNDIMDILKQVEKGAQISL